MKNQPSKTTQETGKVYVPPVVLFEIDLEASAGGTGPIGGSAPFDPNGDNYNPWSIP